MVGANQGWRARLRRTDMASVQKERSLRSVTPATESAGPIYVTQPYLPPLDEFIPYLEEIWGTRKLTNSGPFHRELEKTLAEFLGVEHIALFTNGTIALVTALQALRITGEVITTPELFFLRHNMCSCCG